MREISEEEASKGRGSIEKSLGRAVEKGKLEAADRDAALERISLTTDLEDLEDVDIVIEAVVEDIEVKKDVFGKLDEMCARDTIFASNTSSLTIVGMAAATERADRFVGLHFFNPVPVMKLVEVVRTIATSDETFERSMEFARSLGKRARGMPRQLGLHREPVAGALHAGCDSRARIRGGYPDRYRQSDEAGVRLSDGPVYTVGFRR